MAIGFGATATGDATTARNVAPSYPTVASGDYLFLQVVMKYSDPTVATPSGWTLLGVVSGGAGTDGTVDEGQVKTYQFGNSQSGPYYRLNGIPAGSTTIATLAVPTAWPR